MQVNSTVWARWSAEEDATLREMAHRGATKYEVSVELGRTWNAVAARAVAIRVKFRTSKFFHNVPEANITKRRCLRCRQWFDAPSRFRFVCDVCHASEEWRDEHQSSGAASLWA